MSRMRLTKSTHPFAFMTGSVDTGTITPSASNASKSITRTRSTCTTSLSSLSSTVTNTASEDFDDTIHNLASKVIQYATLPSTSVPGSVETSNGIKATLAIAGGGSTALSALASTPGASSVLLEGSLLYDRRAFAEFIARHPLPPTDTNSILNNTKTKTKEDEDKKTNFRFSSSQAASLLSNAALHQSLLLSSHTLTLSSILNQCVGIGSASSLVSSHHASSSKRSKVHFALSSADGRTTLYDVLLCAANNLHNDDINHNGDETQTHTNRKGRRSRKEEEEVVGKLILWSMLCHLSDTHEDYSLDEILDRDGDEISIKVLSLSKRNEQQQQLNQGQKMERNHNIDDHVRNAAERIVTGEMDAAILVPSSNNYAGSSKTSMVPLAHTFLPPNPIIFPGSFNPPHIGHVSLAQAAVKVMKNKLYQQTGLSSMSSTVTSCSELEDDDEDGNASSTTGTTIKDDIWESIKYHNGKQQQRPFTVLFEMSLTNPDKPSMEPLEVERRVNLFGSIFGDDDNEEDSHSSNIISEDYDDGCVVNGMPQDWGVFLTSAPLFIQKVQILKKYLTTNHGLHDESIPSTTSSSPSITSRSPNQLMTFVIGTDTMIRILNPKYYGGSQEKMLEAVREMGDEGVHFVVGGRLEQHPQPSKGGDGKEGKEEVVTKFVTGEEELVNLPKDIQEMFTIVKEEDFRVDISSTQLREAVAEKK